MAKGKVVVIVGGSDGLGKVIAETLKSKYQVVIVSPTENKLKTTARELGCDCLVADVTKYSEISRVVEKAVEKYGRLDCLINSAGLWIQGTLEDNDPDLVEKVIKVNTLGVIFATKAVILQMKKQKEGLIININSQSGWYAKDERSVYVASKWAVTGFTKSIQPELAKDEIRVVDIHPGGMKTAMFDKAGHVKDQTNFLDTHEVAKTIEFILSLDPTTVFPEIGIKHIHN